MEPVAFQRDSSLRASGYHTLTWAIAGTLASLPFHAAAVGRAWPLAALIGYLTVLACAASLAVPINARRASKLVVHSSAPDDEPPGTGSAGRTWVLLRATGFAFVFAILASGRLAYLPAIGLALLGVRALTWGMSPIREYVILGWLALGGGAVCALLAWGVADSWPSAASVYTWDALLLGAAVPAAIRVNRRYLWQLSGQPHGQPRRRSRHPGV